MSRIIPAWTPASYDVDGAGGRSLGFDFEVDVETTVVGVWWFQETGNADGPATVTGTIYNQGTHAAISSGINATLVQGWNLIELDDPVSAAPGTTYTAAVWEAVNKRAGYTNGLLAGDVTDGTGHVTALAGTGRYGLFQAAPAYPNTGSGTFLHGVDVEFGAEIFGTAVANLGGLTATAAGVRTVHGAAMAALGALTATVAGQRTVHATATASLGSLTAAADGHRTVHGAAAFPGVFTAAITIVANPEPGTLAASGTALSTLAASGSAATLTASGRP